MNIIFLDVDGVLNSLAYFEQVVDKLDNYKKSAFAEISEHHLEMLSQLYNKVDAKIVLSTSWRSLDDKSEPDAYKMYEYLIQSLAKFNMEVIDKTPYVHMKRPLEILTWLKNTEYNDIKFVSLDDDFTVEDYNKYGLGYYLVKTEFFCYTPDLGGLQQRHVDEAIKKFEEQEVFNPDKIKL